MNSFLRSRYVQILTLVLVAQAVLFYSASHGEITPLPLALAGMPAMVGDWKLAQEGVVDEDTRAVLKADDLLSRWYTGPEGGANLFIAYFKTQRQSQSPHSPRNCLPGAGYQPVENESGPIDVQVAGGPIHINKFVVVKGDDESIVLYWYQSQGRVIADEFAAKFYLILDSIRNHRSDTALVRVVVPVTAHSTPQQASQTAIDFVQAMYPMISSWLPS